MSGQAPTDKMFTPGFILILIANFFLFVNFQMLPSTLPVYAASIGTDEGLVGLISAALTVTALIARQIQSSDPSERNDLMFQALDIITADTPYVFIYYPVKNIAINKAYTGVTMNASWIWNIHFQNVHPV